MDIKERKALAEQIADNPLFAVLMDELEQRYIERLVYADEEQARIDAQAHTRAARSFRTDLEALLRDTPPARGGFA